MPERTQRLYAAHAQRLFGFLAYRTGDRVLAEDLLADVFERVLTARRPFDPRRGTETAWLYTIALNVLRDDGRREARRRRAFDRVGPDAEPGPSFVDSLVERDELRAALANLSDEERETVALRFGADLTVPEIARVTDCAVTTIDGRLYRALRKLRAELEPE